MCFPVRYKGLAFTTDTKAPFFRSLQSSSNAWADQLLIVIWLYTLFILLFTHLTEGWSEQKETIEYAAIKAVWITTVVTEVKPAAVRKHGDKTEILSLTSPIVLVLCCARVPNRRILFLHSVIHLQVQQQWTKNKIFIIAKLPPYFHSDNFLISQTFDY